MTPSQIFDLTGKTALITGAGGGIGRWLAMGLAAAGANVVLTDVDAKSLQDVAKLLKTKKFKAKTVVADLRDAKQRQALIKDVASAYGLDILINCAAVNIRKPTINVSEDDYDTIMNLDLKTPFMLSQLAAKVMRGRDGGAIIHIGSINGFQGLPEVGVYGPAKAALEQLTKVQAIEWAPWNIRVNCLAPGFINTPLTKSLQADPARSSWIRGRVPLARFGQPSELMGVTLLLASAAGSFLTGQTIYVDGGFTAGSDWRLGGSK